VTLESPARSSHEFSQPLKGFIGFKTQHHLPLFQDDLEISLVRDEA
jgi:hypothetical protein